MKEYTVKIISCGKYYQFITYINGTIATSSDLYKKYEIPYEYQQILELFEPTEDLTCISNTHITG